MKNPLRFIQEVKQEAFKITWPTIALASIAALFFLLLDQILRFLLNLILTISF